MTIRERILAVYRGETPDVVPYMLDLSHWFYHKNRRPWDLSQAYTKPEAELIEYHRKMGAGFYVANLAQFYEARGRDDVVASVSKSPDGGSITWRYETPLGAISRTRVWEEATYAWGVSERGVRTEQDLRALGYALSGHTFVPRWEKWHEWDGLVGDVGVVYASPGYSAMGHLMHYWMGIDGVTYATVDWPDTLHEVVDQINENGLKCVDMLAASPVEIVIMGDNFSSDIQPPRFFDEWSRPYYEEAVRRLHAAGKFVAVHIDGKLHEALGMIRDTGADCADAVTPTPMGDLTPAECREEAGPEFILSGGVSPDLWLPDVDIAAFERAVLAWLELRRESPRLIANAGDQVPPGADEGRIALMRDLVDRNGRY